MGSDLRKLLWPHRVQAAILLALMIARSFVASAGIALFLPLLDLLTNGDAQSRFSPPIHHAFAMFSPENALVAGVHRGDGVDRAQTGAGAPTPRRTSGAARAAARSTVSPALLRMALSARTGLSVNLGALGMDPLAALFPRSWVRSGLTNADGRVTILMPHPERCFLRRQYSWLPGEWPHEDGSWFRLFPNARRWVG